MEEQDEEQMPGPSTFNLILSWVSLNNVMILMGVVGAFAAIFWLSGHTMVVCVHWEEREVLDHLSYYPWQKAGDASLVRAFLMKIMRYEEMKMSNLRSKDNDSGHSATERFKVLRSALQSGRLVFMNLSYLCIKLFALGSITTFVVIYVYFHEEWMDMRDREALELSMLKERVKRLRNQNKMYKTVLEQIDVPYSLKHLVEKQADLSQVARSLNDPNKLFANPRDCRKT